MRTPSMKTLLMTTIAGAMTFVAINANAWPMWTSFKAANIDASARVIDYSDPRAITTSEGQSYAMFFALVANDRETFDRLLEWTEKNLAKGDITKQLPSWLWGKNGESWGIIDSNNATDSDLWIAYDLLEAARIWNEPKYAEKARAMMQLLKNDVREVPNLGRVLLPGGRGFDHPTHVTLNPSYWRSSSCGAWRSKIPTGPPCRGHRACARAHGAGGLFSGLGQDRQDGQAHRPRGRRLHVGKLQLDSRLPLTGMLSPEDPAYDILKAQFEPMISLTQSLNMPPEKVNVVTGAVNQAGSAGFAACLLELLDGTKTADLIRTVIGSEPIIGENYYRNVLMLYGAGFDEGLYRFDVDGRLEISGGRPRLHHRPCGGRCACSRDPQGRAGQGSGSNSGQTRRGRSEPVHEAPAAQSKEKVEKAKKWKRLKRRRRLRRRPAADADAAAAKDDATQGAQK